jgi:GTP cyclohydrolase I
VAPINKLSLGLDEILVDVAELVATRVMTDNIAETIKAQDIQMNEEQVKKSDLATVTSLVGRLPIYTVC